MNLVERLFALRASPPFAGLYDSELAAIAEVCLPRRFEPDTSVLQAGRTVMHLYVVVEGALVDDRGRTLPGVWGAAPLLLGARAPADVRSDPQAGSTCLLLARPHFLTLVHELPALLLELQTCADRDRVGAP